MGTKNYNNYSDMITFTRASSGTALAKISYGPELVTNGTFDADTTGWTAQDAILSVVGGELLVTADGTLQRAYQSITVESGKAYLISGDATNGSGSALLRFGTSVGSSAYGSQSGTGSLSLIVVASSSSLFITASAGATYDNISVKEVLYDQPDGTLQLFNHPTNQPRVEYDAQGNRLGLLVEEARTNYARNSTLFTGSGWSLIDAAVSAGFSAPDGSTDAYKFIPSSSATVNARLFQGTASIPAGSVTGSFYAKAGELNSILLCGYTGSGYQSAYFNLENGQVIGTFGGPDDYSITQITDDGWFRVSVTITNVSNYHINISAGMDDDFFDSTSVQNGANWNSVNGIYIYGAQVEAGTFPTSYIPTSGATATRSQDTADINTSAFGFNSKLSGTLFVEGTFIGDPYNGDYGFLATLGSGVNDSRFLIRATLLDSTDNVSFVTRDAANTTNAATFSVSLGQNAKNAPHKIAGSIGGGQYLGAANGLTGSATYTGDLWTPSQIEIGRHGSAYTTTCHIKSIAYYPRRLTDAQIKALTSPPETPTLSLTFDDSSTSYLETSIHG